MLAEGLMLMLFYRKVVVMNVRRWKFSFMDAEGYKRFDWVKAISKKHARAIIKSRCKAKKRLLSFFPSGQDIYTKYARHFGPIKLACWESLTTPKGHDTEG
jgi:hypothetical protein